MWLWLALHYTDSLAKVLHMHFHIYTLAKNKAASDLHSYSYLRKAALTAKYVDAYNFTSFRLDIT